MKLSIILRWLTILISQPVIGGQAVIEGVMMRSPKSLAIAVRRQDGSIALREDAWLSFSERLPFLKWPFLRGATMLIESMVNGVQALNFSAEQAMIDEKNSDASTEDEPVNKWLLLGTAIFSMGLGMLIFKGVPHGLTMWLGLNTDQALFHLVDGAIKLAFFVAYIFAISQMNDVKRLFMYHGAEHKSVHTYEQGLALGVDETMPQTTAHPRCGTTLILLVITLSIFVFVAVIPFLPKVSDTAWIQNIFALFVKIPLMLPVAGLAYEFQRLAAKNPDAWWVRAAIAPGMQMQKLTTREPDAAQVEVALTALRKALWREQNSDEHAKATDERERTVVLYNAFEDVVSQIPLKA